MGVKVHTRTERKISGEACCVGIKKDASTRSQINAMVTMRIELRGMSSTNVVAEFGPCGDIYFCN